MAASETSIRVSIPVEEAERLILEKIVDNIYNNDDIPNSAKSVEIDPIGRLGWSDVQVMRVRVRECVAEEGCTESRANMRDVYYFLKIGHNLKAIRKGPNRENEPGGAKTLPWEKVVAENEAYEKFILNKLICGHDEESKGPFFVKKKAYFCVDMGKDGKLPDRWQDRDYEYEDTVKAGSLKLAVLVYSEAFEGTAANGQARLPASGGRGPISPRPLSLHEFMRRGESWTNMGEIIELVRKTVENIAEARKCCHGPDWFRTSKSPFLCEVNWGVEYGGDPKGKIPQKAGRSAKYVDVSRIRGLIDSAGSGRGGAGRDLLKCLKEIVGNVEQVFNDDRFSLDGKHGAVHGDLHQRNIIVRKLGGLPMVIDYGWSGCRHFMVDYTLLESSFTCLYFARFISEDRIVDLQQEFFEVHIGFIANGDQDFEGIKPLNKIEELFCGIVKELRKAAFEEAGDGKCDWRRERVKEYYTSLFLMTAGRIRVETAVVPISIRMAEFLFAKIAASS